MKYTNPKIKKSLKKLEMIKKFQEQSRQQTALLEKTLYRIKYALFEPKDFVKFLKKRYDEIWNEKFENLDKDAYFNPKATATYRARAEHIKELSKAYGWLRLNVDEPYKEYIAIILSVQKKDRKHYQDLGEIA